MSRKGRGRRIRNWSTSQNFTRLEVLPRTAGSIELRKRQRPAPGRPRRSGCTRKSARESGRITESSISWILGRSKTSTESCSSSNSKPWKAKKTCPSPGTQSHQATTNPDCDKTRSMETRRRQMRHVRRNRRTTLRSRPPMGKRRNITPSQQRPTTLRTTQPSKT